MLHRLVINSPNFKKTIDLQEESYSIGRHSSNSIIIPSIKISRIHATLFKKMDWESQQESFYIVDGYFGESRSRNGICINGKRVREYELKHGDVINFCDDITASYYIISYPAKYSDKLENQAEEPDKQTINRLPLNEQWKSTQIGTMFVPPQEETSDLAKLASLVELNPNPIVEISYDGQITYLNSAAKQRFRDLTEQNLEHPLFQGLFDNNHHRNGNLLVREIQIGTDTFEQHIHYIVDSQLIRNYIFDITERKLAEEILHYQAYYDTLTDLPNRTLFNEKLAISLANAHFKQHLMAVMFLDLDGFKNVNDTLGHSMGDELLKGFAERIRHKLRRDDMLSRWGGDEFTILIPRIENVEEAKILAERIIYSLKEPFNIAGQILYIKTSIGIAVYPRDGVDGETLVKNADAALYCMKSLGKNHYQFYSPLIASETSERFQMENLLHEALEKKQFLLYYQPQINVRTGEVCGMEALLRLNHPEKGLISPAKFIPIAEESGLIISIGEWVLRTACQQSQIWQQSGLPATRIAVNLSAQQFQQPNFVRIIKQVLRDTKLQPQLLELEITETTIMQNVGFARQLIRHLRDMGINISMDDFGTGYSSLGYLKQIPFNTIKIDQSFVRDLQDHPEDVAIISAVLAIGKGFNLRVIAEGVETDQQMRLLQQLQCEEMQGYKFSKPLNIRDATEFLASYSRKLFRAQESSLIPIF